MIVYFSVAILAQAVDACFTHNMCATGAEPLCVACGATTHLHKDCDDPVWCPLCGSSDPLNDGKHANAGRCGAELAPSQEWFFGWGSLQLRRWPLPPGCLSHKCRRLAWKAFFTVKGKRRLFKMPYCCRRCMHSSQARNRVVPCEEKHGAYCTSWKRDAEARKSKKKKGKLRKKPSKASC